MSNSRNTQDNFSEGRNSNRDHYSDSIGSGFSPRYGNDYQSSFDAGYSAGYYHARKEQRAREKEQRTSSGRSVLDKEVFRLPGNNRDILITRRHLLYGAAGVGVLAGGSAGVNAISSLMHPEDNITTLSVSKKSVLQSDECDEIDYDDCVYKIADFAVDYGTLIFCNDPNVAATLIPTNMASPLTKVGVIYYNSATSVTVLNTSVGADEGYEIYDVRCNENGMIWTEANLLTQKWRIYTAPLNGTKLGEPTLAAEGDSNWDTPSITVSSSFGFWQEMPTTSGTASEEKSVLKKVRFGEGTGSATTVLESPGRFCTPPSYSTHGITVTPRANTDSVYYQLTLIDPNSNAVMDTLTLPSAMKPLEAGYGNNGFYFCFDVIYNYGDGIANLGTYTPLTKVENSKYSNIEWFTYVRTPTAAPTWCGKYFVVKGSTSVLGFDIGNKNYFVLDVPSGSSDYGTYLATEGSLDTFVTYTNIDLDPIVGDATHECRVNVWGLR